MPKGIKKKKFASQIPIPEVVATKLPHAKHSAKTKELKRLPRRRGSGALSEV